MCTTTTLDRESEYVAVVEKWSLSRDSFILKTKIWTPKRWYLRKFLFKDVLNASQSILFNLNLKVKFNSVGQDYITKCIDLEEEVSEKNAAITELEDQVKKVQDDFKKMEIEKSAERTEAKISAEQVNFTSILLIHISYFCTILKSNDYKILFSQLNCQMMNSTK